MIADSSTQPAPQDARQAPRTPYGEREARLAWEEPAPTTDAAVKTLFNTAVGAELSPDRPITTAAEGLLARLAERLRARGDSVEQAGIHHGDRKFAQACWAEAETLRGIALEIDALLADERAGR